MTKENKELLLKDLCARWPYGVEVEYNNINCEVLSIDKYNEELTIRVCPGYCPVVKLENVKPCLFPLSSMTEEQKRELRQTDAFVNTFGQICFSTYDDYGHELMPTFEDAIRIENWLNENHYDYRGLIEKGLAIDATGLNIY